MTDSFYLKTKSYTITEDGFMNNHQSTLDSQREDKAIQDLQDAGIYPDTDIEVGDYVQTTEEYDSLCSISGEVIEDYGDKVVIIDDCAETDDDRLEFYKSDLQIIEPTDLEMQQSFGTPWHDGI